VIAQRLLRLVVSFLRSCWKRMVMILLGGSRHGAGWGGIELLGCWAAGLATEVLCWIRRTVDCWMNG
jgi:hypothetical protein